MAAVKREVLISQLADQLGTQFQRQNLYFWGSLIQWYQMQYGSTTPELWKFIEYLKISRLVRRCRKMRRGDSMLWVWFQSDRLSASSSVPSDLPSAINEQFASVQPDFSTENHKFSLLVFVQPSQTQGIMWRGWPRWFCIYIYMEFYQNNSDPILACCCVHSHSVPWCFRLNTLRHW